MTVPWALLQRVAVVVTLLGGAGTALYLDESGLIERLRHRFVLGVPWGTVVSVLGVLSVYLFVQGGLNHWYRPVVIPFRAWSYLAPLGMLTAGFSHVGPGHLLGNLFGTLTLAPIVEYAFGHYPRKRGSNSFGSLRTNPFVRSLVIFPTGVAIAGVVLTLFTLGPVIGFSGVVFAFAGFALVRYPFGTVLALAGSDVLGLAYRSLVSPTQVASGRSVFITPWWSDIAIQGHAMGLLAGILLGALFVQRADESAPRPARLWAGVVIVATMQSLWAVYWYRGGTEFVLFRAFGASIIAIVAVLITVAVTGSNRPLLRWFTSVDADANDSAGRTSDWASISAQQVGITALVILASVLAGPAIPLNLVTAEGDVPGDPVTVDGYEVTYAERVPNGMVSAVPLEAFGESTQVNTSGVIVRNEDRQIWSTAVSKGQLAHSGQSRVVVGGVGWRKTVTAVRRGWQAIDGGVAYRVRLVADDANRTAFTSEPAQANLQINGNNVSVAPANGTFVLIVGTENRTSRAPVPGKNSSVTLENITFTRQNKRVIAGYDGTNVTVLKKERYK
ncbi:MAG: rhomboid family intramembrane serine protease [Halolamina sp.]|uniref:rhomboid family intramembrane serine protease n=1 Tax=Halolamina sp. TaxID=1940283 RepID=UPI002FC33C9F